MAFKVLILGASYGSLLGTKLALAGHNVTLVCLPEEAELFNTEGARIRIKPKGHDEFIEINSRMGPGSLDAAGPTEVDPATYDLVGLAMQEPQYRAPEIRTLLAAIAQSGTPAMSIMNMPPLPFLGRIVGKDTVHLRSAYADADVWDVLPPRLMTLASPDPQAMRPPGEPLNLLQVNLPTNFKVAAFEDPKHTAILRELEADIAAYRHAPGDIDLPVKLRVHDSLYVPLAKWAMLITGNYRCITPDGPVAIREAVHGDLTTSKTVYQKVCDLCIGLGAAPGDMVPFDKYAKAAEHLIRPSSAARAIDAGAPFIERVDRIVASLADRIGINIPTLAETVAVVDAKLAQNQAVSGST